MTATPGQADPWQVITDVMTELLRGGQTGDLRCRSALKVLERAGIDFPGKPVALAAAGVPDTTPIDEWPDPENPVTGRTAGGAAPELAALAGELERLAGEHADKAAGYDRDRERENFHRGCSAGLANAAGRISYLLGSQEPKPAPELAAALAEPRELRKVITELLSMFKGISGGYGARTSSSRLRKIAARAGVHWDSLTLPAPDTTEAAETQRLHELLDEIGVMAANAPEEGDSFGVLEQIAMRIATADVPS